MSQDHTNNSRRHEDPAAGPTWVIGLIGVVLFVAIVLAVAALLLRVVAMEFEQKVAAEPPRELMELRARQEARLTDPPRWELRPDSPEGGRSLVIPIEQAMNAFVEETAEAGQEGGS
jgi:hypothetical protein